MIPRDRLKAFVGPREPAPEVDSRPKRTPYPSASDELYAAPNRDRTRKRCGGCYKFVVTGVCIEVAGEVRHEQVCGLHVFGVPQPTLTAVGVPDVKYTAVEAGLVQTPGGMGSSCDTCRFFEQDEKDHAIGLCHALGSTDGEPPVIVESLGCCARWQTKPPVDTSVDAIDAQPSQDRQQREFVPFGNAPHPSAIDIE